ncbi:hypothetical protein FH972_023490 [Carpinus fangiana]|uniref:Peptidase S9 prolyl oligopeptidase catalytic domain-containing protein n=1 Tax=Carpinus fangiana TaxID=176857 RepID=A0A5N6KVY4_9ROSI|nr:hypothetical protein FH972_023490 [Carpinus fangiana]
MSHQEWAIFSATSYSFSDHKSNTTWNLLDLTSGNIKVLPFNGSEVSEIIWLGNTPSSVLYLNATNKDIPGGVTLWSSDVLNPRATTFVASLPAPFSGLKAVQASSGDIQFLVNALAYENGTVYNEEFAEPIYSSGQVYESAYVRHWDAYLTNQRYAVFSGTLSRRSNVTNGNNSTYSFSAGSLRNLLAGINATVTRPETPVQPFGDLGDYDISPDGRWAAFLTKAPELPKANITASYIYLVPTDGSRDPVSINGPGSPAAVRGHLGASSSPRFSPDGKSIAFTQMDGISYESDRTKLYVASLNSNGTVSKWHGLAENWDRSPGTLYWGPNNDLLYAAAEDLGTSKIFTIPINAGPQYVPSNITSPETSVGSFRVLQNNDLLVSASAVHTSMDYYLLSPAQTTKVLFESYKVDPELEGLSPDSLDEFYYPGSLGLPAWIVKPSNFENNRTYPLALIVHGGPQGSTANSWSTRWNLQTWADQGYVVVAPNPTGSTGFGQYLTDAIQNNWGGSPYEDLVLAWGHVAANLTDFVDVENGIEAGASYGGFMTNWIQGHDLGRKFKALVTHDGSTSTHDFAGTLWNNRANYERWDPIAHALNFSTPHFIVHSDKDYRLPVSEGITMFNVLQELGVPSRFLTFPDENHWVLDRENSLKWHKEIFNWINYWSGVDDSLDRNTVTN